MTFARIVSLPENRSALRACQWVAESLSSRRLRASNPLFLHGPAGSGKSVLLEALAEEAGLRRPGAVIVQRTAGDYRQDPPKLDDLAESDLVLWEDLQLLPWRHAEALVSVLDALLAHEVAVIATASVGPAHLDVPARLSSRLAGGLVVEVRPLGKASRLRLLEDKAQRRQLAVSREILAWLAGQLRTGREIDGALARLASISRMHPRPLDMTSVREVLRESNGADALSVAEIARRVGGYFSVDLRQLRSDQRNRHVLLPRQVGMYLARKMTGLSLGEIGAYFGGRDHSTVLHACRKVEQALHRDLALSGAVRQLRESLA